MGLLPKDTRLGAMLLRKGLVTQEALDKALSLQARCRSKLGRVLIGEGIINNYTLHQTLAEKYDLPFADLSKEPCDPSLLRINERYTYVSFEVIPWKKVNGITLLATVEITDNVKQWADYHYKTNYQFAITSPYDIYRTIQTVFAHEDDEESRQLLWQKNPEYSARTLLLPGGKKTLLAALCVLGGITAWAPALSMTVIFVLVNLIYSITSMFKCVLFFVGRHNKEISAPANIISEENLPIYTIIIPLFNEQRTLGKLTTAIRNLDYPKSKLDVKLVVELDDIITIDAIKKLQCEAYFEIITVPYSLPQTKPKACNYALRYAKGSIVTIYDAEDIPAKDQLRKVVDKFARLPEDVICIQAKLNYFNREENILTSLFAIEYSAWFDFMLPGLEALKVPLPLGGTSNHFRIDKLRELHGWDPYNVTEDADLGIRLALSHYHATIIDSLTMEEAPITYNSWLKQRTRWIKGYMQTYIVHMRNAPTLWKSFGLKGMIAFQLFIGAPCLLFLLSPLMWVIWGLTASGIITIDAIPIPLLMMLEKVTVAAGIILPAVLALVAICKHRWWNLLACVPLFPFYWFLHSIASIGAIWQLIHNPHYWEKTPHGVTKMTAESL